MRAMSWRPLALRRNSTSVTVRSNFPFGSYAAAAAAEGLSPAAPATPRALMVFRKDLRPGLMALELRQHCLRAADLVLAGRLDVQLLHHAVLDQHRVALRAHAHVASGEVELQAKRLGPVHAAVAQHADLAARL